MEKIEAILKAFKIDKAFFLLDEKLELVIMSKGESLRLSSWLNLVNTLKLELHKDINFLTYNEAKRAYGSLDDFTYFGRDA